VSLKWWWIAILMQSTVLNGQISTYFINNKADTSFFKLTEVVNRDSLLASLIDSLQKEGFLQSQVDHIDSQSNPNKAYIHLGHKITSALLTVDDVSRDILQRSGLKIKEELTTSLSAHAIRGIQKRIVNFWENNGYPFARCSLDIEALDSNRLSALLLVNKGPLIVFDTFALFGDAKISAKYLSALTGIKPGSPYKESLVANLDRLLRTIPFVRLQKNSAILFIDNKARPMVYLEKRNNDVVDGIIGFAPPASGVTPNQRLLLTGEFKLQRNNLFGSGQFLDINTRFFNERSQELRSRLDIPYIRGSNLGLQLRINGLKFDTLYSQLHLKIGTSLAINGNDKITFFIENIETTMIAADTNLIKITKRLPNTQSMSNRAYGAELQINRLDYAFNPRKGYRFSGVVSVGSKKIIKDIRIASLKLQNNNGESYSIYDSVSLNMLQYSYAIKFENYLPVGRHFTFKTALSAEGIAAPQLFFSDLIRFGGVYSLRGFNEQSLFASSLLLLNLEYRYILAENSNIFAFWNGAYYESMQVNMQQASRDFPFGLGAGAHLETSNNFLLVIAYALGKELNNPIRLQAGKFHFGLTKLF
jgi:translocation and assembly module TamA